MPRDERHPLKTPEQARGSKPFQLPISTTTGDGTGSSTPWGIEPQSLRYKIEAHLPECYQGDQHT
jgi:hypothetical protein